MDSFYFTVSIVAIVMLILILTYIGILMKYYSSSDEAYPEIANTCPDYWKLETDATGEKKCKVPDAGEPNAGVAAYDCQSYLNRYPDVANEISNIPGADQSGPDCTNPITSAHALSHWNTNGKSEGRNATKLETPITDVVPYGKDSIICDLKKWANTNGVVWDGVSNYNKCGL